MNTLSLFPFFIVSNKEDHYKLISSTETTFEKDEKSEFIKPFNPISNKEIGGIKLIYRITTLQKVDLCLFGLRFKWFPKIIKYKKIIFFKPLKIHWNKKLSYPMGGSDNQPFMRCWYTCNQNFVNLYESQYNLHLTSEIFDNSVRVMLNNQCKSFIL